MNGLQLPKLTDYDPIKSSEGALDPLGLYAIADNLAMKLVPGIRERMSHPRFLTAIAVGAIITREYDEELLAADGQSEPYLVYEWHAVEGLVRKRGNDGLSGLPGVLKTRECIKQRLKLSAARYLKTAPVFGFHGVYRLLTKNLDIVRDGLPGENGYELLAIWEKEQGLHGFLNAMDGTGAGWKQQIQGAVKDGLAKGRVDRSHAWQGWSFFGDHLFPNKIPDNERQFLRRILFTDTAPSRTEVFNCLISDNGRKAFEENRSEKTFHQALLGSASKATKHLLKAIEVYEEFSRLLQDAFDDCLVAMTEKHDRIYPDEMAVLPGCKAARKKIPEIFDTVADRLGAYGQLDRFFPNFERFDTPCHAAEWVEHLLAHHINIQGNKPPNGKNPWFEQFDDGSVVIRPGYRRTEGGRHNDSYVHMYRTNPLWSFAHDLKLIT